MEQFELLRFVCTVLDELRVQYFVTGSQATIVYGEPRFTNDIDIVVSLEQSHLDAFVERFPEDQFYLSRPAAADAIRWRGMFNIIHPTSGLKVDVIIPGTSAYDRERFDRSRRIELGDQFAPRFSSPEDVILKKLEFYRIGESDKHLRDIAGVLKISGETVDMNYIAQKAVQLGVFDIWQAVLDRVHPPTKRPENN